MLDRLGTKWVAMVVTLMAQVAPGELRFAELQRQAAGISQEMLSQTLQSLVRDGLAERRVEDAVPPRVHYRLTELGRSLEVPLAGLRAWAEDHAHEIERARSGG